MKKVLALLFIGTTLTFAACQPKPKTEEATTDSTATTTMMTDSASMGADSAKSMMGSDSVSSMMSTTTTVESTTK